MKIGFDKKKTPNNGNRGNALAAGIPLIGFLIFGAIPLVLAAVVSLTELHTTNLAEMEFNGIKNFITILTNADEGRTYASYLSTIFFALNVPIGIAIGLYIANLVNNTKIGKRFFRSAFFIPYV